MNRVIVDTSVHQTRIAVIEDGNLAELLYDNRGNESLVGNIYVGRVEQVIKGMQAAFIDIGAKKNAYLYYGLERATNDINIKKSDLMKVGETVVVQVEKDALGMKGSVVTTKISFPGKFLVLIPREQEKIGISKKIVNKEERERIKILVKELLPKDYGIIIRTNGAEKSKEDYEKEISRLLDISSKVIERGMYEKAPKLIYQEAVSEVKAVRELFTAKIDEFVVNDKEIYETLLENEDFFGENKKKLIFYKDKMPVFENFFVESQSLKAFDKKVWLKCGGFLIIEQTEACVVIDVNTGKFTGKADLQKTIYKTNAEAAMEVAVQMRLRNLSGIIIVDFIDMVSEEDKNKIKRLLEEEVKKDRIKTVVVGMTQLGLMQITRKKTRQSIMSQMTTKCRSCDGVGRLPSIDFTIGKMRREVISIFVNTIYNRVTIRADERLINSFCGEKKEFLHEMQNLYGKKIECITANELIFSQYVIEKFAD